MDNTLRMTTGDHSWEKPLHAYRLRKKGDGELVLQQLIIITTHTQGQGDSHAERWDDLPTEEG